MNRLPRIVAIVLMLGGLVMIAAGSVTYYLVQRELSDENITVSDDAENFAGDEVQGPLTAYSEATVIKKHASEIADGATYAELERDDPRRETVAQASFLRASLFTSVVAFGIAILVIGLGLLFILVGIAILAIDRRIAGTVVDGPDDTSDPDDATDAGTDSDRSDDADRTATDTADDTTAPIA